MNPDRDYIGDEAAADRVHDPVHALSVRAPDHGAGRSGRLPNVIANGG
jgi:hypothetical protein